MLYFSSVVTALVAGLLFSTAPAAQAAPVQQSASIVIGKVDVRFNEAPEARVEVRPEVRKAEIVRGRIVTAKGEPVFDAIVSVVETGSTKAIVSTRTTVDGGFELALPMKAGRYTLRVTSIGYTPVMLPLSGAASVPSDIPMRSINVE